MNPLVKDVLEAIALLATAAGVVIALVKLRTENRTTREQRERDLRWRQAEVGKQLNDEMQTDPRAWGAMEMLDSLHYQVTIDGRPEVITADDIDAALREDRADRPAVDELIRQQFDTFFYFVALFDHYVQRQLVMREDLEYPLEYYLERLSQHADAVNRYLATYKLVRVQTALVRLGHWGS